MPEYLMINFADKHGARHGAIHCDRRRRLCTGPLVLQSAPKRRSLFADRAIEKRFGGSSAVERKRPRG